MSKFSDIKKQLAEASKVKPETPEEIENRGKGRRKFDFRDIKDPRVLKEDEIQFLIDKYNEIPHAPIRGLSEDMIMVEGLIDVLINDGIIKTLDGLSPEQRIWKAANAYGGVMEALVEILILDGVIKEEDLKIAYDVGMFTLRYFGQNPHFSKAQIMNFRRRTIQQQRNKMWIETPARDLITGDELEQKELRERNDSETESAKKNKEELTNGKGQKENSSKG